MHDLDREADERAREEILAEHRELGTLLRRLEAPDDPARVAPVLEELHGVLERHFAREVGHDGLFEIIANRTPSHHRRLAALAEEHTTLLGELAELCDCARAAKQLRTLAPLVRAFTQRFQQHERAECDLLIEALSRDPRPAPPAE